MIGSPLHEAGPARRLAVAVRVLELAAEHRMEQSMGLSAEPLHPGRAGTLMKASKALTVAGAVGAALFGGRSRIAAVLSGAALVAGSACTRFAVFEAGQASARDPRYTVVPQRERLERRTGRAGGAGGGTGRLTHSRAAGRPRSAPEVPPARSLCAGGSALSRPPRPDWPTERHKVPADGRTADGRRPDGRSGRWPGS